MMRLYCRKNRQQGFTIVELLVAAVLGLFVLGGVLHIFSETKKSYRTQDALANLQENGRFALELLAKDIRMAGYLGCSSKVTLKNTLKTPQDFIYNFTVPIQGFEATSATVWTPSITTAIATAIPSAIKGSDIITLRRADDQNFIVSAHASPTAGLVLSSSASIPSAAKATVTNMQSADFLNDEAMNNCVTAVVSDCSSAAAFQITAIATASMTLSHVNSSAAGSCTPKNETDDLGKTYVNGLVYPINTITYYIRANPSNQPALYRKVGKNYAEELVEGIEQMQILYGVDADATADGVANYYVNASSVTDWTKVTSVRVSMLAISLEDNLSDNPVAYVFDGASKTASDKRLRRSFTSTIAIRNRLP